MVFNKHFKNLLYNYYSNRIVLVSEDNLFVCFH